MKRYLALSRTTHAILDIANPGFCALLWLGRFPDWQVVLGALITVFAAYTAIYSLNDLVGIAGDREKFAGGINDGYSVEASELRYPIAQNVLSYRQGWIWFSGWFVLALIGSYLLNPVISITRNFILQTFQNHLPARIGKWVGKIQRTCRGSFFS